MSSVLEVMKPEIESTIKRLDLKHFEPDPIAGPHFSKITSVSGMGIFLSARY
jgi:hypothetical protein